MVVDIMKPEIVFVKTFSKETAVGGFNVNLCLNHSKHKILDFKI